jgi:hypothetical protein
VHRGVCSRDRHGRVLVRLQKGDRSRAPIPARIHLCRGSAHLPTSAPGLGSPLPPCCSMWTALLKKRRRISRTTRGFPTQRSVLHSLRCAGAVLVPRKSVCDPGNQHARRGRAASLLAPTLRAHAIFTVATDAHMQRNQPARLRAPIPSHVGVAAVLCAPTRAAGRKQCSAALRSAAPAKQSKAHCSRAVE